MPDTRDPQRVFRSCTRFLMHHYRQSPREALGELAEATDPDVAADMYGQGELIAGFEAEVAALLGKEAAVFMPSGTMCQQIALRVWTDRRGRPNVALHPRNHLDDHEQYAYQRLHGLRGIPVGHEDRLMTLDDLQAVAEPLGALLLELPQREIGGQLPAWDDLVALTGWARERGVAVHMDGARLWESGPFYGRPYAEIAGLFDSVYVSFYKGLGAIAGSALAGPADVIAEARVWQRRHGGNLIRLYPYVLSARLGLERHLGRMGAYHERAREIAADLAAFPRIEVVPDPPQTNMMHLYLRADPDRLLTAALDIMEETGIGLFTRVAPSPLPAYQKVELTVGDATLDLSRDEIRDLFAGLLERAG
ncbi:MAG TPA: beta-eliminating lyase-related protein [Thermomicrobiales bacterium]|nr:beta-eliminating lyase-related protein [Thermomicrobiales bacterium]